MTTSYTATLALPYPEGNEYVIGGDDAIEALAQAVEARLNYDASLTIAGGESALTVGGATPVDFPGAQNMGGFTIDGANKQITYTGAGSRFFMVAVAVQIDNGNGGTVPAVDSTVNLLHNGAIVQGSYDHVSIEPVPANLVRRTVHKITAPMQLAPGDTIDVTGYASPAGQIGITRIRVYPIGPELPA